VVIEMLLETTHNNIAVASDFHKYNGVSRKEKEDAKTDKNTEKKSDNASISSEAKQATEVSASAKGLVAHVESYPEIREEKVNDVRQKINSGYYDSKEFADNLADNLIKDFGF
jgi:flagellar biosynthesis anti-sigma factor FlgM